MAPSYGLNKAILELFSKESDMLGTILLILLILLLISALPVHGYSTSWGPYPASGLGLVLVIVVILLLLGKL